MGRTPSGQRKYQIEKLWEQHQEVIRLHLLGMKSVDIAAQLGVTEAMVSYTLNSELGKRRIAMLSAERDSKAIDVSRRIKEACGAAVDRVISVVEDGCDSDALRAAFGLLDRAGYAPVQKVQAQVAVLTKDDILEIRERARLIGVFAEEEVIEVPALGAEA